MAWAGTWNDLGTILSTELDGLAVDANSSLGPEIDNSGTLYLYGLIELSWNGGIDPAIGSFLDILMVAAPDGTLYGDGVSNTTPGLQRSVTNLEISPTTATRVIHSSVFLLEPSKLKFIATNKCDLAIPAASGHTIKLYGNNVG